MTERVSTMCIARCEFYRGSVPDDTQILFRFPIVIQRTTIKNLTVHERPLSQRARTRIETHDLHFRGRLRGTFLRLS